MKSGFKAMTGIRFLAVLLLCLLFSGTAALAEESAMTQDGRVFRLSENDLKAICDTELSQGIVFADEGFTLADGVEEGTYVSLGISMPEFTMISLGGTSLNTGDENMPALSISVYRPSEAAWGPFIDLPDGENARRDKGTDPTVTLRFRVILRRAEGLPAPVFSSLIVSAGEHLFTKENLIMVFIMISAGVMMVMKRKKAAVYKAKKN